MLMFALYLLFLLPLLSLDTETDATATQYDYGFDNRSFSTELLGKPPLDHQISSMLLLSVNHILLHSLSLLLELLPLPAIDMSPTYL